MHKGSGATIKPTLIIALCVAILAAACWERHAERNDKRAYFAKDGDVYRVEMKGWRFPLVHDPFSLLVSRTHEETFTMALPRMEGVIEGAEIPVAAGKLGYVGRVIVANGKMKVDLYYEDLGDGTRRPLPWNDDYTLVPKNGIPAH